MTARRGVWYGAGLIYCYTHVVEAERKMAGGMETSSTGASRARGDIGLAMSERPTCILCLGMAGSGKTTFVQVESPGTMSPYSPGLQQPETTIFFHTCRD